MNNKGFVYIETIIAVVVLTSSLLLMYTSFNHLLQAEKSRIYYDDIAYVYRTEYLKRSLNALNIKGILADLNESAIPYTIVGAENDKLFLNSEKERNIFLGMMSDLEVSQIVIVRENRIDKLKSCNEECALDPYCSNYDLCSDYFNNLSKDFISYIKSLYIDVSCTYVMLVEYKNCNDDFCTNYYSWAGL